MKKSRVLSVHPYNDFGGGASAYTFPGGAWERGTIDRLVLTYSVP